MKILILGAGGMLGHDLVHEFKDFKPILWDRDKCDITDEKKSSELILELAPELIINAAAYTDVEGAEDNEQLANLINAQGVKNVAQAAREIGATLVHISTEYVFDGKQSFGYDEDSKPNPLSAYGRSKYQGEVKLIQSGCKYYLVRTSWLYGKAPQMGKPRGKNFIDTIIAKAEAEEPLKVVDDQYGRPTYTRDLARSIRELVLSKLESGIYHAVNEGETTWYGLAQATLKLRNIDVKIEPCASSEYPSKAIRPQYSLLNNNKLPQLRDWQVALKDYLNS